MYAIIETGGKQYKVSSGDVLNVELFSVGDEKNVKFDRVLMVGGEGSPKFGSPLVAGASSCGAPNAGPRHESSFARPSRPSKA